MRLHTREILEKITLSTKLQEVLKPLPEHARNLFSLVWGNYNEKTFTELDILFSAFETKHPELKPFIADKRKDIFEKFGYNSSPSRLVELANKDKLIDIEWQQVELEYNELNEGKKIPAKIKKQIKQGLFSPGTDFEDWNYASYWNLWPCANPKLETFICEKCKIKVVAYKSCPFCKMRKGS